MHPDIAVTTTKTNLTDEAEALAARLQLPFTFDTDEYAYLLQLTPKQLGLIQVGAKMSPLAINFLSGQLSYRREHASLRNEALARALGLNHRESPTLVDATAGIARDSFILASLGFKITLLERSPIIHALLEDGMQRALKNDRVAPIIERMYLIQADAIDWLKAHSPIDTIYLDPMFPDRQKKAQVKKEMQLFQALLADEPPDDERLLATALACANKRVVVKRPRLANPINGTTPSFSMKGVSSRFDIYLK